MHFRTLLFVNIPQIPQEPEWEKEMQAQKEALIAGYPGKTVEDAVLGLYIGRLTNVQTAFGREVTQEIYRVMERFYCYSEDPKYLVFEDKTEEYRADFEKVVDCVVMPDGKILPLDFYPIWRKFIIKDGVVFQKEAGKLHHPKRTRKAKKMKALPGYPRKKLYASFDEYVEEETCGRKNEETGQYGEWFNPDGVYDWYSIGGRWPDMFLVKQDCVEYSYGERGPMDENRYPAPEGYLWVACARKKDIQWEAMRTWRNKQAEDRFHRLEEMFETGQIDHTVLKITEEGIYSWREMIYRKGQTLEEFLSKYDVPESWKYPISVCGVFTEEEYFDVYCCEHDPNVEGDNEAKWHRKMEEFIDDEDDETVFVGIDYHI